MAGNSVHACQARAAHHDAARAEQRGGTQNQAHNDLIEELAGQAHLQDGLDVGFTDGRGASELGDIGQYLVGQADDEAFTGLLGGDHGSAGGRDRSLLGPDGLVGSRDGNECRHRGCGRGAGVAREGLEWSSSRPGVVKVKICKIK